MYSKELRDLISICIQPDPRKRPELSQLRERCEQMCRLLWLRIISINEFFICQSENNGELSSSRSMPRTLPFDLESLPFSSFPKDYHFHANHFIKKIILIFVTSDYNFINKPPPLSLWQCMMLWESSCLLCSQDSRAWQGSTLILSLMRTEQILKINHEFDIVIWYQQTSYLVISLVLTVSRGHTLSLIFYETSQYYM